MYFHLLEPRLIRITQIWCCNFTFTSCPEKYIVDDNKRYRMKINWMRDTRAIRGLSCSPRIRLTTKGIRQFTSRWSHESVVCQFWSSQNISYCEQTKKTEGTEFLFSVSSVASCSKTMNSAFDISKYLLRCCSKYSTHRLSGRFHLWWYLTEHHPSWFRADMMGYCSIRVCDLCNYRVEFRICIRIAKVVFWRPLSGYVGFPGK